MTNQHEITLHFDDPSAQTEVFGAQDCNLNLIEKTFSVQILFRSGVLLIKGERPSIEKAQRAIEELHLLYRQQGRIDMQSAEYLISRIQDNEQTESYTKLVCHTVKAKPIFTKTLGQKRYVEAIENNDIVFGIGPAGTGKTFLAMALAVKAFKNNMVNRLVLARPAVEAGERLGFLPGDMKEKVDPYLRPLYDAMFEIMGSESCERHLKRGEIEIAPLAYMRGRTLDKSYIILDEAQNTTPEQMKMFLTRLGEDSKAIITGDITQIDLPYMKTSGLIEAQKILKGVDGISFCTLTQSDVVRNPLVKRIIKAYEDYEKRSE